MSDLLIKLWQNGILQLGIWETIYMTLISPRSLPISSACRSASSCA